MANFTDRPVLGSEYINALGNIAALHICQVRKDGRTPYLAHLLTVSSLVLEAGGDETTAIAALFHDSLEDISEDLNERELAALHGSEVASIAKELTEDKSLPKAERKMRYALSIATMSPSAVLVALADKLHNLRSIAQGTAPELINPVNAGFYKGILISFEERVGRGQMGEVAFKQYQEMVDLVRLVF